MSDPKRMLGGEDEIASALLGSARGDRPGADARRKAAAAIGISLAASTTAVGTTATAASAGSLTTLAKLILLGAVVTSGAVASSVAFRGSEAPGVPVPGASSEARPRVAVPPVVPLAPAPTPSSPPEAIAAPEEPAAIPGPTSAARASAAPVGTSPPSRAIAVPPAPATSAPPTSSAPLASGLVDELEVLDRARAELDRGAADAALAEMDAYARRFPHGELAPEATVIRLDALAQRGSCDELRTRADAFLAVRPSAPQSSRVRSLVRDCRAK